MNWEKVPCRHCGMKFENLNDRDEHERCHVASTAEVKTELNSRCSAQSCCLREGHDGGHRCSVCNWPHRLDATESDVSASETYEAHECYPLNEDTKRQDEDEDFASTPHPSAHYERTEDFNVGGLYRSGLNEL